MITVLYKVTNKVDEMWLLGLVRIKNAADVRSIVMAAMLSLLSLSVTEMKAQRKYSLQECIDMALGQNALVKMADKAVEKTKTMEGTAWDIEKTELSLAQDPTSGGSPDNALSFTQSIDFPTVYVAKRKLLKAETNAERSRRELVKATLVADVADAYLQWVYERSRFSLLSKQDSILKRYYDIVDKRQQAGAVRKLDALVAQRMMYENQLEMTLSKNNMESCILRLCNLLNVRENIIPSDTVLRVLHLENSRFDYGHTPAGMYANAGIDVADKTLAVEKNGFAPSLSFSLRSQLVMTSWNPYHQNRSRFDGGNFMGFEIGVGIPLFFSATKARIKAALKEREIKLLEMSNDEQVSKREYEVELEKCRTAYAKIDYYREQGGAIAEEMKSQGMSAYENGEISCSEYVDILQDCVDTQAKTLSAIHDYNQSVIAMKRLSGQMSFAFE